MSSAEYEWQPVMGEAIYGRFMAGLHGWRVTSWWPARVVGGSMEGGFDLLYSDGDWEEAVPVGLMLPRPAPSMLDGRPQVIDNDLEMNLLKGEFARAKERVKAS